MHVTTNDMQKLFLAMYLARKEKVNKRVMLKAICPLCKKEVGPKMPGAKVYHLVCLTKKYEKVKNEKAKNKK